MKWSSSHKQLFATDSKGVFMTSFDNSHLALLTNVECEEVKSDLELSW